MLNPTVFETACAKGVVRAFKSHLKFTGGLPLTFAPEAFIQGQIALELAKHDVYATLETTVYETLSEAKCSMRGRPPKRFGGRLDLVTWWKNSRPRLLIEVKKLRHKEGVADDLKRIRDILRKGGSIRGGIVVVYADAKRLETIQRRIDYAANSANCQLAYRSGPIKFQAKWDDGDQWFYEVACLRVKLPKRSESVA